MLSAVEFASALSLLTNIENEINASNPFIFTEPCQYSRSESDMSYHGGYIYESHIFLSQALTRPPHLHMAVQVSADFMFLQFA